MVRTEAWTVDKSLFGSGTEVRIYPQGELKSPFFNGRYMSWVAYLHQDDSFKDRYAQHIALTQSKLGSELLAEVGPDKLEELGVGIDGIGIYQIVGQPKLYVSSQGVGNAIGHMAVGLWHFREGMTAKDIYKATNQIFSTQAGRAVVRDAQKMSMILPAQRGTNWDLPPNAELVLQANFTNGELAIPTYEQLMAADAALIAG